MKTHKLHTVTAHGLTIPYFYIREYSDRNGDGRFRVYMIDAETNTIHERTFTTNESQIPALIMANIESGVL